MSGPQTPVQLLRNLDRLLQSEGKPDIDPWRCRIAQTVAAQDRKGSGQVQADQRQAGRLFAEIANKAYTVCSVLGDAISMDSPAETIEVTIAMVQQLGWLADRGASHFGDGYLAATGCDADDWFLSPGARQALGLAGQQSGSFDMGGPQTPVQLLRNLDRVLQSEGKPDTDPWRCRIAQTVAAQDRKASGQVQSDQRQAGQLFADFATKAHVVSSVLGDAISMDLPAETLEVTIAMVQQMGWLADRGASHFGDGHLAATGCDADDWFLSPGARQALGLADPHPAGGDAP